VSTRPLPYTDSKPLGAADFYYAINATFTHIRSRYGLAGLQDYWRGLGRDYQRPVWERWRAGGLPAVAEYWSAFFAHEPGGSVDVHADAEAVRLDVRECPAISHLRQGERDILDTFCHHCAVMGDAAAEQAGLAIRIAGGNGRCVQICTVREGTPPQDFRAVSPCDRPAERPDTTAIEPVREA
jgi:hypothetical protein